MIGDEVRTQWACCQKKWTTVYVPFDEFWSMKEATE